MRFLPMILLVVLAIYCLVEIAQSNPAQVRQLPRPLWALIVLIPLVGPIGWLVWGRPNGEAPTPRAPRRKTTYLPPDDDPDFLRKLKNNDPGPYDL